MVIMKGSNAEVIPVLFVLLLCQQASSSIWFQSPMEVRLAGGSSVNEGRLEVLHNGTWGTVCELYRYEGYMCRAVCRQLGYSWSSADRLFDAGHLPTWLYYIRCDGHHLNLKDCYPTPWGEQPCNHEKRVGCFCQPTPPGTLRLVGGSTAHEGRVEVFYNETWGSVCGDVFNRDNNGCTVVCRQLGYSSAAIPKRFRPGTSNTRFWLDGVTCNGSERRLMDCNHRLWRTHSCGHNDDAGCSCKGIEGDVRLVGGSSNREGRIEVFHDEMWGTVCDVGFDAGCNVICRQLGYSGFAVHKSFGPGVGPIWLHDLTCQGHESRVTHCRSIHTPWGSNDCEHFEDAGCVCESTGNGTAVYTVPTIRVMFPQYGPEAGGTLVTFVGSHLGTGYGSVDVNLGDTSCQIESQHNNVIIVTTPKLSNSIATGQKLQIRAAFLSGLEAKMEQPFTFEYRGNPVIKSVKPLEAIAKGGTELTVTGNSFDSVAQPIMVITAKYNNTQKRYESPCEVQTPERLICLSPTIDNFLLRVRRSKRDAAEVEYHISFLLDWVEDYNADNFARNVPEYSRLGIIAEPPKMKYWDDVISLKPGEILTIFAQEGEDLQRGCSINDYRVNIDRETCRGLKFHTNSIQCETPTNTTGLWEKGYGIGDLVVVMHIGNHSDHIGRLRFESEGSGTISMWLLISGGLAVILLMLTWISTAIVRRKTNAHQQKSKQVITEDRE